MKRIMLFTILMQSLQMLAFRDVLPVILQNNTNSVLEIEYIFKDGSTIERFVAPQDFIVLSIELIFADYDYSHEKTASLDKIHKIYCYKNNHSKYEINLNSLKNFLISKNNPYDIKQPQSFIELLDMITRYSFPVVTIKSNADSIISEYGWINRFRYKEDCIIRESNLSQVYEKLENNGLKFHEMEEALVELLHVLPKK